MPVAKPDCPPNASTHAMAALSRCEGLFALICQEAAPPAIPFRGEGFPALARAIVGQQISVKAADQIWANIAAADGTTPEGMLRILNAVSASGVRGAVLGLSRQKVFYLQSLAAWCVGDPKGLDRLRDNDDAQAIETLTRLPGIGRWTAEMYLIFSLGRPDVFSAGDHGVLQALGRHLAPMEGLDWAGMRPSSRQAWARERAQPWAPYRSTATWLLWHAPGKP